MTVGSQPDATATAVTIVPVPRTWRSTNVTSRTPNML